METSLETRSVLLIFLFELEFFWGGRTGNTSKQRKVIAFTVSMTNFLVKMTLRLF